MGDALGKFIKPMITLYGELGTDDMDLVIELYTRQLKGYADDVLEAGFHVVAGSYMPSKKNPWPAPAICRKACDKAIADGKLKAPPAPEKPRHPEWSKEAIATADRLVQSELGRQAARDTGWVLGLHDFCREHRRLPTTHEVPSIIAGSAYIDRCAAGALDMGRCHGALQRMAQAFLEKREKLARRVLGEGR